MARTDPRAALRREGASPAGPARPWLAAGLLAVGALVGLGLGLLFAPRSGTELRRRLTGRLRSGRRLPYGGNEPDIAMSPTYGTQTTPPPGR